jgi:hypothetical protein
MNERVEIGVPEERTAMSDQKIEYAKSETGSFYETKESYKRRKMARPVPEERTAEMEPILYSGGAGVSDMEAVKARYPDARCVEVPRGCWLIAYGDDPEHVGFANLGPDSRSEAKAWANMRARIESMTAEATHES